jgi:zinc transport system ATP-binding protein
MDESLLRLEQATVAFSGTAAVDRVDLTVNPGDIITLIGPNGAGKTTLIKAILGIQPLSGGRVWRRRGLRTGYMPQRLELQPTLPLSVERFLAFTGANRDQIRTALARSRIEHLLQASIHTLSGGEMQRLLLSRALLRKPHLLVLDEPAQAVDVNGQAAMYELIRSLRDELSCAVLMISHDLHLVMASTDRVICLNQHICCSGAPEQVSSDPAFIELFGQRIAESLAVYHHHHNHRHSLHGEMLGSDCQEHIHD